MCVSMSISDFKDMVANSEVILKGAVNFGRPLQIPHLDIRQIWLPTDTPINVVYPILV